MSNKIDRRELMKLGGAQGIPADFYGDIAQNAGFEVNMGKYVQDVYNSHVKQLLSTMGNKIINCVNDDLNGASEYLRICRETIEGIEKASEITSGITIEEAVEKVKEKTHRLQEGDNKHYMPSGIRGIDKVIVGFQKKQTSLIAARTSVGKTASALTMMSNMTLNNIACGFISVEMSEDSCLERLTQVRSSVEIREFTDHTMSEERKKVFYHHLDTFKDNPLIQIQRTTKRGVNNIRHMMRNMKNKNPDLAIIFLDYIQKVQGSDPRQDMRIQQKEVSGVFTDAASDLDIHISMMAQLSRAADDSAPELKHLKESSNLEEDCWIAMLLNRDLSAQRSADNQEKKSLDCQVSIAKNRDGPTGLVDLKYNALTTKFYDGYTDYSQNNDI
jgi:replicative DNA helicase